MQNMCKGVHLKYRSSVMGIMLKPTYLHGKNTVDELNMIKAKKKKKKRKKKKKETETVDANVVEVEPTTSAISYLKVYQR